METRDATAATRALHLQARTRGARPFTVALIGADGSGKSTIGRRLERSLGLPAKYIYMGVNLDSSNLALPTTRLILHLKRALGGRPDMTASCDRIALESTRKQPIRRVARRLKSNLRMVILTSEEWFRQALAWVHLRRGHIILFDRHFYCDYYGYQEGKNGAGLPWAHRLHAWLLERLLPRPDLVVYLDAPSEILLARKGEGSLDSIEKRRRNYSRLGKVFSNFVTVDARQSESQVLSEVEAAIRDFQRRRK